MYEVYTSPEINSGFICNLEKLLKQNPEGLSEYELIQLLRAAGFFEFLGTPPATPHSLFIAHFLVQHSLYKIRGRALRDRQGYLEISALKIQWLPYKKPEHSIGNPDSVRQYYLDIRNLYNTNEQDVDELLASFWIRLKNYDQRADALEMLGLEDPVDNITIKQTYRRLAMRHHPDRGGNKEQLQPINAAVKLLLKSVQNHSN